MPDNPEIPEKPENPEDLEILKSESSIKSSFDTSLSANLLFYYNKFSRTIIADCAGAAS